MSTFLKAPGLGKVQVWILLGEEGNGHGENDSDFYYIV